MSVLHNQQIKNVLQKRFLTHVNTKDLAGKSSSYIEDAQLSRGVAALSVSLIGGLEEQEACMLVTDGYKDNGIDALYHSQPDNRLYVIQSKWSNEGRKGISVGETQKLIQGFDDLIHERYENFNERIINRAEEIQTCLRDGQARYTLVISTTSQQPLPAESTELIQKYLTRLNDPTDLVSFRYLGQKDLHTSIANASLTSPIQIDILLSDWGKASEPHACYYGKVSAVEIADWWRQHSVRLFDQNLRHFIRDSSINQQMVETLRTRPEEFLYFNNGITLLANSIDRKMLGGSTNAQGVFECRGISVVNGAQTVGSIGTAVAERNINVERAYVMVRIISTGDSDSDFSYNVTQTNNTQNRIDNRDFIAADPNQSRIAQDLLLSGVHYSYKTGELAGNAQFSCDIEEATIALACRHSNLRLTVMAKGQIGTLWRNVKRPPYNELFNENTSGDYVWSSCQTLRQVEKALRDLSPQLSGRRKQFSIHGNRFIQRQCFRALKEAAFEKLSDSQVKGLTIGLLDAMEEISNRLELPNNLAWTFKNTAKCQMIEDNLSDHLLRIDDDVDVTMPTPVGALERQSSKQPWLPFKEFPT